MKFKLELQIETPEWMFNEDDPEEVEWYKTQILTTKDLVLHSQEMGDSVGKIESVKIISIK